MCQAYFSSLNSFFVPFSFVAVIHCNPTDPPGNRDGFFAYEESSWTEGGPLEENDIVAEEEYAATQTRQRQSRQRPFSIQPGAPSSSLSITNNGYVGIGTDTPATKLHVMGSVRIEQGDLSVVGSRSSSGDDDDHPQVCVFDTQTCSWKTMSPHGRHHERQRGLVEDTHQQQQDSSWEEQVHNLSQQLLQEREETQTWQSSLENAWQQQCQETIQQQQKLQQKQTQLLIDRLQTLETEMAQLRELLLLLGGPNK